MQETYNVKELIIGELVTISNLGGFYGVIETTEGPFIFNKKGKKYSEIFTEEEYGLGLKPSVSTGGRNYKISNNLETNEFGKTYIKPTEEITNYLTEEEHQNYEISIAEKSEFYLTKKRLLEIYNQMKEKQAIEKFKRENEEHELERQFTKLNQK